jgi:hypothetical protein
MKLIYILITVITLFTLTPISRCIEEIVLNESDLKRFIGRIDDDPKALNGRSVWLDPLIAGSPPVTLKKGSYTFYLYARCLVPVAPSEPVCRISIIQTESETVTLYRDVMRGELGDGQRYALVEWPFEIQDTVNVRFDVDMKQMGNATFYLDSIGYRDSKTETLTRWNHAVTRHHVGVSVEDTASIDGMARTNAHALAYGPYMALPKPGQYEAVFRMAIAPDFSAENIATLDVFSHAGLHNGHKSNKTYAIRGVSSSDFPEPDTFVELILPFEYDGADGMEFRVLLYHVKHNAVRLDKITVRLLNGN